MADQVVPAIAGQITGSLVFNPATGGVIPSTYNGEGSWYYAFVQPSGTTLTQVTFIFKRDKATSTLVFKVVRQTLPLGGSASLVQVGSNTIANVGSGVRRNTIGGLSEVISSTSGIILQAELASTGDLSEGVGTDPMFYAAIVTTA